MATTVVRVPTSVEEPTLVSVTLWRLLFAGSAWAGVLAALVTGGWEVLRYFTQVSTLCVALSATASLLTPLVLDGALESRWGVARGAATTYATITLLVFATMLGADYSTLTSLLTHLVVPLMAVTDWLLVGRNQRLAWWWPLAWLSVPLLYLVTYVVGGEALYRFLVPGARDFADYVLFLLVAFVVVGYAWWGIGQVRSLRWPPQTVPAAEAVRRETRRRRR